MSDIYERQERAYSPPPPWREDPRVWRPAVVRSVMETLHLDPFLDPLLDSDGRQYLWQGFTPELRDRYVEMLDFAVTELRRLRATLVAADWRTCVGCEARFVGPESARYHSAACKQRAYRQRQRDG